MKLTDCPKWAKNKEMHCTGGRDIPSLLGGSYESYSYAFSHVYFYTFLFPLNFCGKTKNYFSVLVLRQIITLQIITIS